MTDNILHSPAMYRDMVINTIPELIDLMPEDTAAEIAHRIAANFCKEHGGKFYRVPQLKTMEKAARDKIIREQAQTMSVQQVAREHSLTERQVREILSGE